MMTFALPAFLSSPLRSHERPTSRSKRKAMFRNLAGILAEDRARQVLSGQTSPIGVIRGDAGDGMERPRRFVSDPDQRVAPCQRTTGKWQAGAPWVKSLGLSHSGPVVRLRTGQNISAFTGGAEPSADGRDRSRQIGKGRLAEIPGTVGSARPAAHVEA